jgi:hypothetical protein
MSLLKINLFRAEGLRGTQLSTGRQADCDTDQQSCVRDHVTHSRVYNKPHPRSIQQASMRDHGITHQVSRIDGYVFLENQVLTKTRSTDLMQQLWFIILSLPLQPAVSEKMR